MNVGERDWIDWHSASDVCGRLFAIAVVLGILRISPFWPRRVVYKILLIVAVTVIIAMGGIGWAR